MTEPNWNLYREQFPKRYWELGEFDLKLKESLHRLQNVRNLCHMEDALEVLDVGGGVYGTEVLKEFVDDYGWTVDLLDPFITEKPSWMNAQIDYDSKKEYDLIICRGSINYLSVEELYKVANMKKYSGALLANTFLNPPSTEWAERQTENGAGIQGIERFRLNGNKVEHQTIFGDFKIEHEFFFHSQQLYEKMFHQTDFVNYGKNSTMIHW